MSMSRSKPPACSGCPLCAHGTDFSAIEGTGSSGVLLVGEASGEHEQRDGLPFRPYAPAGSLLERTFRRMGIDRKMFAITNAIRCRPRNNWLEGSPWEYSALAHCRKNLDAAIAGYHPRAIMALGGTALRELTGEAGEARGISHLAGYVLPLATSRGPCGGCISHESLDVPRSQRMTDASCDQCHGTGYISHASTIPVIGDFHPAFLRRGKASHQGVFARIIQRAVNIAAGKDRDWLWNIDPNNKETHGTLNYNTHPTHQDVADFVRRVLADQQRVVSYDLETSESASLDEDAREGFVDTRIRLAQFSIQEGTGIALDSEVYREAIQTLMTSSNPKCGHNIWLFDDKVLRAQGIEPAGVRHDTLQMYHHWQPDLPAHLQFAASFVNFPFPWKHLAGTDIEFYGCADVDATLRLYTFLKAKLIADGIWGDATVGYLGQVACVRPVLAAMEDRGVPIDDAARVRLGSEFEIAAIELLRGKDENGIHTPGIVERAPTACQRVHPKEGYAGNPPEVREWFSEKGVKLSTKSEMTMLGGDAELVKTLASMRFQDSPTKNADGTVTEDGEWYTYQRRSFRLSAALVDAYGEPTIATESAERWCRVYDFNPNSSQQLIAYMKSKGHKVPKSKEEDAEGNSKNTTAKKELQRLAHRTEDNFYLKVIEYRELSKARGTYIDGFKPGPDGRVHTTFTFDTGTGQTTSRNPNVQNFLKHGRLAKATRAMIAAPEGHVLAEADFKSYHVLTTGFCAEDESYMRMARLDMHSFVTGAFLKEWDAGKILSESDESLLERFAWLKSDPVRKRVRDKQAKPSILGIGFGMGYRRLYQENMEHYSGEKEAKKFHDLLHTLFPKVFAWQDQIRKEAHERQHLRSPFGHLRRFYEVYRWDHRKSTWAAGDQAEEAVAFLPANIAFGGMREAMKAQRERGLDEKYGLVNSIHDSFVYVVPKPLLEEFLVEVPALLTAPSKVLVHPVLAPRGLSVEVEVAVGENWSVMKEVKVATGASA